MKSKLLKNLLLTVTAVGMIATTTASAQQIVDQKAYYDNFIFKVNGTTPYISDFAKKPFVANNRTYIPISTLSELGICSVTWVPPVAKGQLGEVLVTPPVQTPTLDPTLISNYQSQIDQLKKSIDEKDKKIKELEEKLKNVDTEKKEKEKEKEEKLSDRDLRKKASDLEYDVNKDRDLNRVRINGDYHDIKFEFDYRRDFDVVAYIDGLQKDDVEKLKDSRRDLEYVLEDVADKITKDKNFKDVSIYFRVIDKKDRNKELFKYDYRDGRLR